MEVLEFQWIRGIPHKIVEGIYVNSTAKAKKCKHFTEKAICDCSILLLFLLFRGRPASLGSVTWRLLLRCCLLIDSLTKVTDFLFFVHFVRKTVENSRKVGKNTDKTDRIPEICQFCQCRREECRTGGEMPHRPLAKLRYMVES